MGSNLAILLPRNAGLVRLVKALVTRANFPGFSEAVHIQAVNTDYILLQSTRPIHLVPLDTIREKMTGSLLVQLSKLRGFGSVVVVVKPSTTQGKVTTLYFRNNFEPLPLFYRSAFKVIYLGMHFCTNKF